MNIMVIPQSTIVGFYIASAAQILLLAVALFVLQKKHPFRFTSVVVGFGVYFIASQILTSFTYRILQMIPGFSAVFESSDHVLLYYLLLAFLTAVYMSPVAFMTLKLVRKGKWNLYEAIASGISYWLYTALYSCMTYINQAKIADIANKGQLETLVTEDTTIDVINDYVNTILKSASLSQCLAQVLYFITMVMMSILIFMLLYHGMKRQKPIYILYGIGIHFASLYIAYLGTMTPIWSYCLILLVLAAAYCTGIWFYFRWYHRQQQILLQQRREFKERKNAEYRAKIAAKEEAAKAAAAIAEQEPDDSANE